jgi:hypothetical protein
MVCPGTRSISQALQMLYLTSGELSDYHTHTHIHRENKNTKRRAEVEGEKKEKEKRHREGGPQNETSREKERGRIEHIQSENRTTGDRSECRTVILRQVAASVQGKASGRSRSRRRRSR